MEIKKTFKIETPTFRNDLYYLGEPGKKQDGLKFNNAIPVVSLTEEEANEYAEFLKKSFMSHWRALVYANSENKPPVMR